MYSLTASKNILKCIICIIFRKKYRITEIVPSRNTPFPANRSSSRYATLFSSRACIFPSGWLRTGPFAFGTFRFAVGTILIRTIMSLFLNAIFLLPDFEILLRSYRARTRSLVLRFLGNRPGASSFYGSARRPRFRSSLGTLSATRFRTSSASTPRPRAG